jgi:hypothetical protein
MNHRPTGERGLRHGRGQRRATVGIDLAVDRDDRDRILAPALDDDVDRPAGFHRTADTAVRPLREGQAVAGVVRVEAARYRCTGSPQGGR